MASWTSVIPYLTVEFKPGLEQRLQLRAMNAVWQDQERDPTRLDQHFRPASSLEFGNETLEPAVHAEMESISLPSQDGTVFELSLLVVQIRSLDILSPQSAKLRTYK